MIRKSEFVGKSQLLFLIRQCKTKRLTWVVFLVSKILFPNILIPRLNIWHFTRALQLVVDKSWFLLLNSVCFFSWNLHFDENGNNTGNTLSHKQCAKTVTNFQIEIYVIFCYREFHRNWLDTSYFLLYKKVKKILKGQTGYVR